MKRKARGASLLALLVALSLSLGVTLSSLRVMAMSNAEYVHAEQAMLMDEQAGHVLDLLVRFLQQAGHLDPTQPMAAFPARPPSGALAGHDNAQPASAAQAPPKAGGVLGSDLLELRLAGDAAGRILDCTGLPVPVAAAADEVGVNQFFVALDRAGEPELRCRTRAGGPWNTQAIAAGVCGFQLLYGLDAERDGLPNDFVSATTLRALDAGHPSGQPSAWTRVVAVHVALLLCSARQPARGPRRTIDLFGDRYAQGHAARDPGVRLGPEVLDPYRRYQRYDRVIFLNNSLEPAA